MTSLAGVPGSKVKVANPASPHSTSLATAVITMPASRSTVVSATSELRDDSGDSGAHAASHIHHIALPTRVRAVLTPRSIATGRPGHP